jgi:hypothetical protein
MNAKLKKLVWERARGQCEYCHMAQEYDELWFEIDHIMPRKHGGQSHSENLALACFYCNNRKGPNLAGIDPLTGKTVPLFHPRLQTWRRHFQWVGAFLVGKTQTGRATISVLDINLQERVTLRGELIRIGAFP